MNLDYLNIGYPNTSNIQALQLGPPCINVYCNRYEHTALTEEEIIEAVNRLEHEDKEEDNEDPTDESAGPSHSEAVTCCSKCVWRLEAQTDCDPGLSVTAENSDTQMIHINNFVVVVRTLYTSILVYLYYTHVMNNLTLIRSWL